MQAALRILGYNDTYHFFSIYTNIRDTEMWRAAIDAKYFGKGAPFGREQWDMLLGHCAAVCDIPAVCFGPELIAAYPEAKVVLVSRNIDNWYKSFDEVAMSKVGSRLTLLIAYLSPSFFGPLAFLFRGIVQGYFHSSDQAELRRNARQVYLEHYDNIRKLTPKARLLEFDLAAGWEPLCAFLGKEVPKCPFPRINERAAINEKMRMVAARGMWDAVKTVSLVLGAVMVAMFAIWYWSK